MIIDYFYDILMCKIFFYSANLREDIVQAFDIPRHIAVIMSYADYPFPKTVKHWTIRDDFHPLILQALFYARYYSANSIVYLIYNILILVYFIIELPLNKRSLDRIIILMKN
jgi:hypothetical protein